MIMVKVFQVDISDVLESVCTLWSYYDQTKKLNEWTNLCEVIIDFDWLALFSQKET